MSYLSGEVGKLGGIIVYLRSKGVEKACFKAIIIFSFLKININLAYNNID
jgi:hypothetical protein